MKEPGADRPAPSKAGDRKPTPAASAWVRLGRSGDAGDRGVEADVGGGWTFGRRSLTAPVGQRHDTWRHQLRAVEESGELRPVASNRGVAAAGTVPFSP